MAYPSREQADLPPDLPIDRSGRIRLLGPVTALLVPLTLAVVALVMLVAWPCSGRGCIEPSLAAWVLVLFAVPTALISGLPWIISPLSVAVALGSSLAVWMGLGALAGRRTAAQPHPTWRGFAVEMLTLTAGIIGGVLMGFALIALWIRL